MKETRVVHCKKEKYDVYIGRPSEWGNPFNIGEHGTRQEVIELYEEYLRKNEKLMAKIMELDSKVLGCWCKPKSCHGDVIVKIIQELQWSK
ncbi:MAG: DUF4326 domain-containing protein [Candidatus Peribacteraceae bacterium]|nr:DUF4326 domain-containing protein [Candidatus Peribacteraceae bacterium]